jgi:hypothetical protein
VALFVVSRESPHSTVEAWRRLTNWPAHARYVPFTRITVTTPGPNGVGTSFVAHTGVGRVGFDDPMQITAWAAPETGGSGRCRLDKLGHVVTGWAELTVEPKGSGTLATWREDVAVARLPRLADAPTALSSRLLFGRVLRHLLED